MNLFGAEKRRHIRPSTGGDQGKKKIESLMEQKTREMPKYREASGKNLRESIKGTLLPAIPEKEKEYR